jgi:hypothetical protein
MVSEDSGPFSLRRWSQRKLAARRGEANAPATSAVAPPVPSSPGDPRAAGADDSARAVAPTEAAQPVAPPSIGGGLPTMPALPDVESLTFDSDFSAFLRPDVDESLKRNALRKLFSDPHFNVMDGLDVYIDDYTKPDPIEPAIVRQLVSARRIFAPTRTRINAQGIAEDVPDDDVDARATSAAVDGVDQGDVAGDVSADALAGAPLRDGTSSVAVSNPGASSQPLPDGTTGSDREQR